MRAACTYRLVAEEELTPALFSGFDRTQEVTQCWRRVGGAWRILPIAFVERWGAEDYAAL